MNDKKLGVTYEEYEVERIETRGFLEELDKKMKGLIEEADIMYAELSENKTDKLFIDYVLTSQNVLKLQDMKLRKLEKLKEMENNIVFN